MIAEIIPLMRTIPQLGVFDYAVPEKLKVKIGDIVKINFRNKEKIGLVYKIKANTAFKKIKPLIAKIDNICLLKEQVDLITWLAKKYNISPALAFKSIFPEIPKKISNKKFINYSYKKITVQKNRIAVIKKTTISIFKQKDPILLHYNDENEKNAIISGLIQKNKKQILIVVPEKKDVFNLAAIFSKFSPLLLYSGLAENYFWHAWQEIKLNKVKIIIGTKMAIFMPPDNLALIIVDHEEDKSHFNFDQNPKYHVLEVAQKIIEYNKTIKLLLTSQAPAITSYYNFKHCELFNKKVKQTYLLDLKNEKLNKNYSYFSQQLVDLIKKHYRSLLLYNKKGDIKLMVCQDCQEIIPSPAVNCPSCHSMHLKNISYGVKKLKKDLEKILPNHKIIAIEKEKQKKIIDNDFTIAIGTEYALRTLDLKTIDFFALISIDHQLAIPDYQAGEKAWQLINKMINLNKEFAIQTNDVNNFIIQSAINQSYQKFYEKEIALRKQFAYPPFDKTS